MWVPLCVPESCLLSCRNISKMISWCHKKGSEWLIFSFFCFNKVGKKKKTENAVFPDTHTHTHVHMHLSRGVRTADGRFGRSYSLINEAIKGSDQRQLSIKLGEALQPLGLRIAAVRVASSQACRFTPLEHPASAADAFRTSIRGKAAFRARASRSTRIRFSSSQDKCTRTGI